MQLQPRLDPKPFKNGLWGGRAAWSIITYNAPGECHNGSGCSAYS